MTLPLHTLATAAGQVTFTPYGAQVLSYIPVAGSEVLWHNTPEFLEKAYLANRALRAGVPLCWPWFLKHPTEAAAPSHGFARLRMWRLVEHTQNVEQAEAHLELLTDGTDVGFPYRAKAELHLCLTQFLHITLTTTNLDEQAFPLTQALHTYLQVGEIDAVTVQGLESLPRVHITPNLPMPSHDGPLTMQGETELRYSNVAGPLTVRDGALNRTLEVVHQGCGETVIWNPGAEKAAGLDMQPDGYRNFLCVEAANIIPALELAPGAAHTLATTIRVL